MADRLTVERLIDAPARDLQALVADVTRMAERSPENVGPGERGARRTWDRWVGGDAPSAVVSRCRSTNRQGRRSWRTTGTVTVSKPGRVPRHGGPELVADWHYFFEAAAGGTRVVETWGRRWPSSPLMSRTPEARCRG